MQNSATPVQGGDLPVTNYSGADIPAGVSVKLDVTVGNYFGVLPIIAGDAGKFFGVTLDKIKAGRPGRVRCLGSALMTAKGAVTAGDILMMSVAVGFEGQASTQTAALAQIGRALTTAADAAEVVVWLAPAKNA